MEHKHIVRDRDARFVIDLITKAVKNTSKKFTIAQYSHNSERITFEIPRLVEEHDMSSCTSVEIHYQNIDAKTKEYRSGYYEAEDLMVDPEDENKVICSWLISNNGTQLAGLLNFTVWYICKEDGVITYAWPTVLNTELTVGGGFKSSELVITEYVDVIEQWKQSVMDYFKADIAAWKSKKAAELEANLTAWKEAESDEVHRVMGDYETHMNKQLDVERKRIDAFVTLKDGSTTGDAELQDIRIGADGATYGTAGDAVRTQFGAVTNNQRLLGDKGLTTFAPYANWVIGGMMSAQITAHKNRIMSSNILCFDRAITIKIAEGFRIGVHRVTVDGTFVSDSNWQQTEYKVSAGTYFKIVVARISEDSTEQASITEFSNAVTFNTFTASEISKVAATAEHHSDLISSVAEIRSIDFKGAYHTTGGSGAPNNRIHASDIVCDSLAVVTWLDPNQEYFYGVDLYTNDSRRIQISTSGWMRTSERPVFIVNQNCVMDISISKISANSFDNLSEMDGIIKVSLYDTLASLRKDMGSARERKKCWLTSAHQGFVDSFLKPNSLAAYYNAYLNGADMIETDAWFASDGVLVVNHDPTVTGTNASGDNVTYTISETLSTDICDLVLSSDDKWGVQRVPTLEQVLNLAYHTGLVVNIDIKNGYPAVEAIVNLVLKCGMRGKVIYALNGSGMKGINTILAKDPDARFIDSAPYFMNTVADFAERGKRCFAFTGDMSEETVNAIREGGCMVALISLNASNFEVAIAHHPDMCEFLHVSDFRAIEDAYFSDLKLY